MARSFWSSDDHEKNYHVACTPDSFLNSFDREGLLCLRKWVSIPRVWRLKKKGAFCYSDLTSMQQVLISSQLEHVLAYKLSLGSRV